MNYAEYLENYGQLTYRFKGISMMPMLRQGKDTFTVLKKTPARCRKYDVALYRRGDQYVLHRVVKVLPEGYVMLGDNCLYKERGIGEEQVIGILESFTRGKRTIPAKNLGYQCYARLWYAFYPLRFVLMWFRSRL